MPSRSAGRLYRLLIAVAGVGLALVLSTATLLIAGTNLSLPTPASVAEFCGRWLSDGGAGALLVLALAGLALLTIALGLRSTFRQVRISRRYLGSLVLSDEERVVQGVAYRLVEDDSAQAFCAGYLRPRIFLSRGALARLTSEELRAVIAHETHHIRRRDPLRLLLARSLAEALFFVPILSGISERYGALGELAADEAAVRGVGDRVPLASALLKFGEPVHDPLAVVGIAPERVDYLMGEARATDWRLAPAATAGSVAAIVGLGAMLLAVSHGLLASSQELPLLLAAGCMVGMVGGPVLLTGAAIVISHRAIRARRA